MKRKNEEPRLLVSFHDEEVRNQVADYLYNMQADKPSEMHKSTTNTVKIAC